MARMKWSTWLIVCIGLLVVGEGLGWLLFAQNWTAPAVVVRWSLRLLLTAWVVYGLVAWRHVGWVRRVGHIVGATGIVALVALLCVVLQWNGAAIAVVGAWAMVIGFYLGLLVIRLVCAPAIGILGVARTLVDEAIRMKVALVLIITLLLFVSALPFVLDPDDQLRYRIQTFLTWSMMVVSVLLSLMTVFLAVGTITNEVANRQIYLTLTKPLSRAHYLLGKWLGVALLNLLLVSICGGGIYGFTQLLARLPALSKFDEDAVKKQVLVARMGTLPVPGGGMDPKARFKERLTDLRNREPDLYGESGGQVRYELKRQIQQMVIEEWRGIAPRNTNAFLFRGLGAARQFEEPVQLRLKPKAGGELGNAGGFVYLRFKINGRAFRESEASFMGTSVLKLADDNYHVLNIPPDRINERGEMEIEITNVTVGGRAQPTISFNVKDGMEVLYRVGGFEANLARSLALLWIRLGFLAMLGITAGTFLGFPIACLLAFLVFIAAAASGYISESLEYYATFPENTLPLFEKIVWWPKQLWNRMVGEEAVGQSFRLLITGVGGGLMKLMPKFSHYSGTALLSDGRLVSFRLVLGSLLWIGLVWTGLTWLIGYVIFRGRELARVIV